MNHNLYTRGHERVPSYLFLSTGTAPVHPAYSDPRRMAVNPNDYRKYEKIQEQVQKKKAKETPPTSPTEAPILLFQGASTPTSPSSTAHTLSHTLTPRFKNQHHLSLNQRLAPLQQTSPRPFK
jgi:hypothetical protein